MEDLKEIKSNIINWYDFRENSNILVIGNYLKEVIEKMSLKLSRIVYIDNFKEQSLDETFDYILIKDDLNVLDCVKKFLKPDGTILLLINNRIGISNFAGADDFKSICEEKENVYTKKEIENILTEQGFSSYKFFYPLPNYQIANVIFSDDYLPEYNNTKLMNTNLYEKENVIVFDERKAIQQLTKVGEFQNFANSYLVEINPKTEIKFVSFNNIRKKEYRLCTKLYKDYVVKEYTNEASKLHIANMENHIKNLREHGFEIIDRTENEKIVSKYISEETLYQNILKLINARQVENAVELIQLWFKEIKSKFIMDRTDRLNQEIFAQNIDLSNLTIVKNAYIDLVFENTFMIDNNFVFFDQEWVVDNLPLEFILYRAINNMYMYNSEIEEIIARKEFLEKFNLLNYLSMFEEIEKVIQNVIIDREIMQYYNKYGNVVINVKDIAKKYDKLSTENFELTSNLSLLKDEEKKKEEYIQELIKEKAKIEAKATLLEIEEKKKEDYIQKLTEQNEKVGLLEEENKKKEKYIEEIKSQIVQKEEYIENLKNEKDNLMILDSQKDEIINHLNEIIKAKDNQISVYENMKTVKLVKKLRRKK